MFDDSLEYLQEKPRKKDQINLKNYFIKNVKNWNLEKDAPAKSNKIFNCSI